MELVDKYLTYHRILLEIRLANKYSLYNHTILIIQYLILGSLEFCSRAIDASPHISLHRHINTIARYLSVLGLLLVLLAIRSAGVVHPHGLVKIVQLPDRLVHPNVNL